MNETELIFSEILHCDRVSLYQNRKLALSKENSEFLARALARRMTGEPVQYIMGKACFMGFDFKVNPQVLIPRPETEILVEKAIEKLSLISNKLPDLKILDIGTGSGCIAIALAKFFPEARITAIDVSPSALEVARENAKSNQVEKKIIFLQSNLFASYELRAMNYELIISNPPYISAEEFERLEPEVKFEPHLALDGGGDGLEIYRRIIKDAHLYLKASGFLILEIGFGLADAVKEMLKLSGKFILTELVKDYNHIDRIIVAKRKN